MNGLLSRIAALTWFLASAFLAPLAASAGDGGVNAVGMTEEDDEYADEFDEYAVPEISDPIEPLNRTIFKFNATVMKFVIRPISRGYESVVPSPARRGLSSFFQNIRYPVRLVSNVLQGDPERAVQETEKFLLNTTVGIAGFIKVSDRFPDLRVPDEDIGQAFGKWGIPSGPYLVVPVLGPFTVRDGFGAVGDYYLTPLNWGFVDELDTEPRVGLLVLDKVVALPGVVELSDMSNRSAIDPYISMRNGYIQFREEAVKK